MFTNNRFLLSATFLVCGLAANLPAHAATRLEANYQNSASACQLSIPTTDTQVRPKATGFRNESTTRSAFVICGYDLPTIDSFPLALHIEFVSLDGVNRTVSCTAVTGLSGLYDLVYSSKSAPSYGPPYYDYGLISWTPTDFGSTGSIPNGFAPSVTCTLPPQTAITMIFNFYDLEIGS